MNEGFPWAGPARFRIDALHEGLLSNRKFSGIVRKISFRAISHYHAKTRVRCKPLGWGGRPGAALVARTWRAVGVGPAACRGREMFRVPSLPCLPERSCPVGFARRLPRSWPRLGTMCPARPRNSGLLVRHGAILPRHRRQRARRPMAENKGPVGHRSAFSDRRAWVSRASFPGGCDPLPFRRDCRTVRSIFSFEMACVLQPVGSRFDSLNHFRPVRARRDTGIAAPIS